MGFVTRVLLILALVLTAFWVFTIVDCAAQPSYRHRGVSKPVWILIVILLPVLGGILWFVVGRVRASALTPRTAPDDDIEFLGRIGTMSDQDERIRRLEEELAQLDAEDDDPKWQAPDTSAPKASAAPTETGAPADPPVRGAAPDADDDGRGQRGAVG
jgi:cytoskeletal protein RodZ